MFRYLAEKVCGSTKITYNGIEIDLGKPFARLTMNDAIKKYAGVDLMQLRQMRKRKSLQMSVILSMKPSYEGRYHQPVLRGVL